MLAIVPNSQLKLYIMKRKILTTEIELVNHYVDVNSGYNYICLSDQELNQVIAALSCQLATFKVPQPEIETFLRDLINFAYCNKK